MKKMKYIGLFVVLFMLTISFLIITNEFDSHYGAQNIEASYHVLLTVQAIDENNFTDHYLLPIVTLGDSNNKHIPWGETLPTSTGNYIYSSFTSPGFVLPYVWFSLTGLDLSLRNLAYFNFLLTFCNVIILYLFLFRFFTFFNYNINHSVIAAILGTTVAIFSREALHCAGVVYWSHCMTQVLLVLGIRWTFEYLVDTKSNIRRTYAYCLLILCYLIAYTEWTGFVFNGGLILIIIAYYRSIAGAKWMILGIVVVSIAAMATILIQFGLLIGFEETVRMLSSRYHARGTEHSSFALLMRGYMTSYSLYIPVIFIFCLWMILRNTRFFKDIMSFAKCSEYIINNHIFIATYGITVFPLIENLILMQHAQHFSFDRLKLSIPMALAIGSLYLCFNNYMKIGYTVVIIACVLVSIVIYNRDRERYCHWAGIDQSNHAFVEQLRGIVDLRTAVITSHQTVRGYTNLLFHRNIYEHITLNQAKNMFLNNMNKNFIWIDSIGYRDDIYLYTKAIIYFADGKSEIIMNNYTIPQQ